MDTVERVTPGTQSWMKYGFEHLQRYEHFAADYRGKKVLDAACGTGYGSHFIASSGATAVTGIDVSAEALDFCRQNYKAPNLQFRQFDVGTLSEMHERFDTIVSFETIEHLQDPARFIQDVSSILAPGGIFICSTPNPTRHSETGTINPFHHNELSFAEFRRHFEKYFHVSEALHQTESIEYLRYLELKHLLHQERSRTSAFLFNRLELWLRRMMGREFKPAGFFHPSAGDAQPGEISIQSLAQAQPWHKTFILRGIAKNR